MALRTRVLLLVSRLGGGGAEHVMALLAGGLSQEKYEVHLGLIRDADAAGGTVPPWVAVHALGAGRARAGALPLLRLVWRLRPGVVLSGATEVSFLVLLLRPLFPWKTCVLVRQNATVSSVLAFGRVPRYTRMLYRLLYRCSDRVICQSRAMAEDLAREAGIGKDQIVVLPNPVDLEGIRAAGSAPSLWSGAGPHLLAVGRLSREKGFDLLVNALVAVRQRFPEADLILAGAGREEKALRELCRSLGLEAVVRFAGHVGRPYDLYPGATLFVLSSRHEGMPNALLEAATAGLCPLWPPLPQEGLLTCSATGLAHGWLRRFPLRLWLQPSLQPLMRSGRASGSASRFSRRRPICREPRPVTVKPRFPSGRRRLRGKSNLKAKNHLLFIVEI